MADVAWYFLFSCEIVVFAQAAYFLMSTLLHKAPDVPWSKVHPLAEGGWIFGAFFRAKIVRMPQYLTDEGRRRAKWGHVLALAAAILWVLLYIAAPGAGIAL